MKGSEVLSRWVKTIISPMILLGSTLLWFVLPIGAQDVDASGSEGEKIPENLSELFKLDPKLEIQLVASEPLVDRPIAIQFDRSGSMWVVESDEYNQGSGKNEGGNPNGKVVRLKDTDGDGIFDQRVEFLDQVESPTSVLPLDHGVLIIAKSQLHFWQDTDGDEIADRVEVLSHDLTQKKAGIHPMPNTLTWGVDNWIEAAASSQKIKYKNGKWILAPTNSKGHWGISQDDVGRWYYNEPKDPLRVDLFPATLMNRSSQYFGESSALNGSISKSRQIWPLSAEATSKENVETHEFTTARAPLVYRAALLPLDFYVNVFVCDPKAKIIRRNVLKFERDRIEATNADQNQEFLSTTDPHFSPVHLAIGPEGALYVVDHQGDLGGTSSAAPKGRIYRIVPKSYETKGLELPQSEREWLRYMGHANALLRMHAQQILVLSSDASLEEDIRVALQSQENLIRRLHAMWILEGRDALTVKDLQPLCYDVDFKVRSGAIQILGSFATKEEETKQAALDLILKLRKDSSLHVEILKMLALGSFAEEKAVEAKWKMLSENPDESWMMEAFYAYDSPEVDLSLLKFLIKPYKGKQGFKVLRESILQHISFKIWNSADSAFIEIWEKLYDELSNQDAEKTSEKFRDDVKKAMRQGFERWLLNESKVVQFKEKPDWFERFLSDFPEALHSRMMERVKW